MIVAGVDIGSLTAKAVILQGADILGYSIFPTGPDVIKVAEHTLTTALDEAGLLPKDLVSV